MAYLAHAGYDVFSMDMTAYGRSTRPAAMNDPCNLTRAQQAAYIPSLIPALCDPSYSHQMTTLASDWQDIDAVVNRVRALRATVLLKPHVNPAPGHREIWVQDPDGYVVVIASPDGEAR